MMSIKEAREKAGFTQKQIADLIGIPKRTLENYEQGSRQPAPWIEKLLIKEIERLEDDFMKTRYMVYKADVELNFDEIEELSTYTANGDAQVEDISKTLEAAEKYVSKLESDFSWVSGHKYLFTEHYVMRQTFDESLEEWEDDYTDGPLAVSDFYPAKAGMMRQEHEFSTACTGDTVDLSEICDLDKVPEDGKIYVPVTDTEGYLYTVKPNFDEDGDLWDVTILDLNERAKNPNK